MKKKKGNPRHIVYLGVLLIWCTMVTGCKEAESNTNQTIENTLKQVSQNQETVTEQTKTEDLSDNEEKTDSKYPLLAVPATAEEIDFAIDSEGIYCFYDGAKYGYLTETGEELTGCIYDTGAPFLNGLACVSIDGKYGYINKMGETAIPLIYDDATSFSEGLAYFAKGDEYGFMNPDGTAAFYLDCDSVSSFREGLAYFCLNGKYGYIDKTGQVVIAPIYGMADYFEDGVAIVSNNGYKGAINTDGLEILPLVYDSIEREDGILFAQKDGKYDCYSKTGEKLLADSYEYIEVAGNGYIVSEDGKSGYVNEKGEIKIPIQYEVLELLSEEYFVASKNGLYGVIDGEEKELLPFSYEWIYSYSAVDADGLVEVCMDDKYGWFSLEDFSMKIPMKYDGFGRWINGYATVSKDGLWGIMDKNGEVCVPIFYDNIKILDDGAVVLKKGEEHQLYSSAGELLQTGNWEYLYLRGDFYVAENEGVYTIWDKKGEEVLETKFDYVSNNIYENDNADLLKNYGEYGIDKILKFAELDEPDMSEFCLKNSITPRNRLFWELTHGGQITVETLDGFDEDMTSGDGWYRETCWLYDINNEGNPILYYYAEPYDMPMFPQSTSALFVMKGEELQTLVTGYECGGSMRGDYVCFWRDTKTNQIMIGNRGATGGFGGIASYGSVYTYENSVVEEIFSYNCTDWFSPYYSDEELLENAELFYDSKGNPYTKENILLDEELEITEYMINDERVTREEYEKARARYESLDFLP